MTPAQQQARMVDRIVRVRLANDRLIQQSIEKRREEKASRPVELQHRPGRTRIVRT